MPLLPVSNCSLLVRTAEGHDSAWALLVEAVQAETAEGFLAHVELVDDARWYGCPPDRLRASIPPAPIESAVLFLADETALRSDEFPILVVDLMESRPAFRCIAAELWSVENNLNIANMDWEEFAERADSHGVFRGIA